MNRATNHSTRSTDTPARPDLAAVKARQREAWSAGDYALVGTTITLVSELLCEAVDLRSGARVLDVATGNGGTALAAARRWCSVVAVDYVPSLLQRGRERAAGERLVVDFREGDAEDLTFDDGEFDYVLSTFGAMFAPDQHRVARELLRVCRRGGRIGMSNWTPESFVGAMFKIVGRHVAPPAGVDSPLGWGTEARLRELFVAGPAHVSMTRREFVFRYPSAAHWLDVFRTYYGPVHKAFAALDARGQAALERDLLEGLGRFDRARDGSLAVPSEYLEVVVTKG